MLQLDGWIEVFCVSGWSNGRGRPSGSVALLFRAELLPRSISSSDFFMSVQLCCVFNIYVNIYNKLRSFLNIFNQQDPDIKFTIELENNRNLPFLDVFITKREIRLDLSVYRKPTHSDRYLRYDSYNHPIVKIFVVYSLVDRAFLVCSSDFELKAELDYIRDVLIGNGYHQKVIDKVISSRKMSGITKISAPKKEDDKPFLSVSYIKGIIDILSSKLTKLGFKVFFPSGKTISSFLNKARIRLLQIHKG